MKIALITGVNGQDVPYLSELLLKKGYLVQEMVDADMKLYDLKHVF